jgi:amino acid transporter
VRLAAALPIIDKAFPSFIGGLAGWLLVAGYVGTLALYASALGDYGATLIQGAHFAHWVSALLSVASLCLFLGINLLGAKLSGSVELAVVGTKLCLLALFAGAGMIGLHASHFVPVFNRGWVSPLAAVALIFVAYEGFELIPNAIADMENPTRNLPRAIIISIVATSIIYVVVAIAALGNLTTMQIRHDQEYVLAVAAKPELGHTGFILIGVAAVLSTSSAINATLFGAARLAMVMAAERALPKVFARQNKTRHVPWVALVVLTGLALALTLGARLSTISTFASATFLLIFSGVNLAAVRKAKMIGIQRWLPLTGAVLTIASFVVLVWHIWTSDRVGLYWLLGFYGAAIVLQAVLGRGRRGEVEQPG